MRKIGDAMTKNPVTVQADTPLIEIAQTMQKEDTGFVPVCENGQLKGVITDRDIVLRAVATGMDFKTVKASDVLSPHLVAVTPTQDLKDGVRLMEEHQIRRLCVVEAPGSTKLVGVVSLGDLAEIPEAHDLSEEVLERISRSMKTLAHAR